MYLHATAKGHILGIGYSSSVEISLDSIEVLANVYLDVINGKFDMVFPTLNFVLSGFSIDLDGILSRFEGMIGDIAEVIVEGVVSDALEDEIPPAIEGLLNDLPMDYDFDLDLPTGQTVTFNLAAKPARILTNPGGDAFTIQMDARILTEYTSGVPPELPGSIMTSGPAPQDFGLYSGTSGTGLYDLGLYIADDIINQALYQLYRAGAISFDIEDILNTSDAVLDFLLPELAALYPDAPINLSFRPLLPPVIMVGQVSKTVTPLPTKIQMGDLLVHMYVQPAGLDPILILSLALSFDAPAGIGVSSVDNALEVTLGSPIVVADLIAEPVIDFNDTVFEALAQPLVDIILPIIGGLIGSIEIPTFSGYGIQLDTMLAVGQYSDYIGIWTTLIVPPPAP
jgi:hypothetical protein